MLANKQKSTLAEQDQILIPFLNSGYKALSISNLFGNGRSTLNTRTNQGMANARFIVQSGPYQHGSSPLNAFYNEREMAIGISEPMCSREEFFFIRNQLIDLLRPTRAFNVDGSVTPQIYRRWLAGGMLMQGNDMELTNGSDIVRSTTARFIHFGGVTKGKKIETPAGDLIIEEVINDYTARLTAAFSGSTQTSDWSYWQGQPIRDLPILFHTGLLFDDNLDSGPYNPTGYNELVSGTAHSVFWQGEEQEQSWSLDLAFSNLVFDGEGAWFGDAGRWLFAPDSIGEATEVIYWGTQEARPVFEIIGPANTPAITNLTIGLTLSMPLYNIAAGEIVTIDTSALTVESNLNGNISSFLEGALSRFGLTPNAFNRVNEMFVTFDNADENSRATMKWRNLYAGI